MILLIDGKDNEKVLDKTKKKNNSANGREEKDTRIMIPALRS